MKLWTDYLIHSQAINAIYHGHGPTLKNVNIHEIIFNRDGPKISIRLNLNCYPKNPPKKWLAQKFNTTQITLSLMNIKEAQISGWVNTKYIADIEVDGVDDEINIKINSS
ncbi:Imm50 family immunity protein [Serratia marcescens]|uniref:Imm50 family immunity protein n=1 Tax=Serratia marcescens TaxID=615 RepID=UPI000E2DD10B|nr:Imm50 family immunity protein [Serratia marcescens]